MAESSNTSDTSLAELRQEIDALDASIHAALIKRMAVVQELAGPKGAKGAKGSMRPAREMEILRALVAAHDGAMPVAQVIRIWREIMAASLALQSPFSVHLLCGENDFTFWDLVRFHFGSAAPMVLQTSFGHVLQEVSNAKGAIGVVPEILFEEDDAWWPHLLFAADDGPRVIAKLPLFCGAPGYNFPDAMVIGNIIQRPTGDDASLLVVQADVNLRRAKVAEQVTAVGIDAQLLSLAPEISDAATRYVLFETAYYVAEDDARLNGLNDANKGITRAKIIGGYARPIHLAEGVS